MPDSHKEFTKRLEVVSCLPKGEPWLEFRYKDNINMDGLISFIHSQHNFPDLNPFKQPFLFRGQANAEWSLTPKLHRILDGIPLGDALEMEYNSIHYFKQRAHLSLSADLLPTDNNDNGAWLGLMQHYGAPTRMLDWTTMFNVALYFAAYDDPTDINGAVWIFQPHPLYKAMKIYHDITTDERKEIFKTPQSFVKYGTDDAKPKMDTYDKDIKSDRMLAQHSMFTFCEKIFEDHGMLIGKALYEGTQKKKNIPLIKLIITPKQKAYIRSHLAKMGISSETLFPGADGVGKKITETMKLNKEIFHSK